jgi:hypothetical protein
LGDREGADSWRRGRGFPLSIFFSLLRSELRKKKTWAEIFWSGGEQRKTDFPDGRSVTFWLLGFPLRPGESRGKERQISVCGICYVLLLVSNRNRNFLNSQFKIVPLGGAGSWGKGAGLPPFGFFSLSG